MGGTISSPLSQETRDLFKENPKFFEALGPALEEAKLRIKMGDPETRTETKALENGDVEVTFIYPLDDNNAAADGRLYLRDKFIWDSKESQIKTFHREFSYNGEGDREGWKPLLEKMKGLKGPDAEAVALFGMTAGRSYSRPFTKPVKDILKGKIDYFNTVAPLLQEEGLKIKLPDENTHYTLIHHAGKNGLPGNTELIFSYVVNDEDDKTTGKAYLRDSFLISATGELLGYDRKWDVDVNASAEDKKLWKDRAARLAAKPKPTTDEAKSFIKGFVPAIYEIHPTPSVEKTEYVPPTPPEGGFVPMTQTNFTSVMNAMVSRKKAVTGDKIESDLLHTLSQLKPYFSVLEETIKPEIALKLDDPRIKFTTTKKDENITVVTMEMTLSEGVWAEQKEGVIRYKERFIFEKGKLKDVERSWKIDGADGKGRLAGVVAKLDQAKAAGYFPPAQSMPTAVFLVGQPANEGPAVPGILNFVAPDLIYAAQPKLADQEGLDFDRKMVMGTLGQLHENLKGPLSIPGVDPKLAARMNRALLAVQHGDIETFQAAIGQIEHEASEGLKSAGEDSKKALQDVKAMSMIISLIVGAQFDEARMLVDHLHSPLLKKAFEEPVDQIWRRKHVLETIDILEKVALDDAAVRARESTAYTHRGPRLDTATEQQIVIGLFQKAKAFSVGTHHVNSREALKALRNFGDGKKPEELSEKDKILVLTEDEKKACDRLLGHSVFTKLENIEKERSKDMQAKQYFELARGEIFEKGYIGAAQFLAQKVVIEKMPKSRSQEGLTILAEAGGEIFQNQANENAKKKGEQAVKDMAELYKSDPKKFEEVYKAKIEEAQNAPELKEIHSLEEAAMSLGKKWAEQVGTHKDKPLMSLLQELTGLSESEKLMSLLIQKDPTFAAIVEASKAKTRDERIKGYTAALEALVQKDQAQGEIVSAVYQNMMGDKFPDHPQAEALTLILNLASLPIAKQSSMIAESLLIDKVTKEAEEKAKKEFGDPAKTLPVLIAMAKLKAANMPDSSILDVLKALKDEEVNPEGKTPEIKKLRDELVAHPVIASLSQIAAEPKAEERGKKYKAFSEGIVKKTAFLAIAQGMLQLPTAEAREAVIKKIEEQDEKKRLDKVYIEKLSALAKETGEDKRKEMVEGFKKDAAYKESGMVQLALWMDQMVTMGKIPEPELHAQDPAKMEADKFARDVKQFIDLTEGKGNFGTKIGYGMPHFVKEVSKPTMLAAMFGAGLLGPYVEMRSLYAMRNLGTFGRVAASVAGITAESLAFNGIHKTLDSTFYHSQGQWDHFGKDVVSTALLFGSMRVGHYATGTFAERVLTSGRFGTRWAGGRVVGEPGTAVWTTPAGKIFIPKPGAKPGIPQLTSAGKATKGLLDHAAGIGGMMGSGYISRKWIYQKDNGQDWQGNLADAVIGYTHAMIGFSLANRATGGAFHQTVAEIKIRQRNIEPDAAVAKAKTEAAIRQAKEAGLLELLNGDRKDVQLTDMVAGKDHHDIKLTAGEKGKDEFYLDQSLLGKEGKSIVIRKKADGSLVLVDSRVPEAADGAEPGTLFKDFQILEIDGKTVQGGVEIPLAEGQVIRAGERQLGVSLPAQSPLIEALAKLTHDGEAKLSAQEVAEYQMRLGQKLAKAKDLTSLLKELKDDWRPGGPLTFEILNALIEGKLLLHNLPKEIGFQGRIRELMKIEVEKMAKEVNFKDFELEADFRNSKWSQVEVEFHTAQKVRALREGVSMSQEIGHVLYFMKESHLKTLDGVPAEAVRDWVELQSLKVRKNDVSHELGKAKKELEALEPKEETVEPKEEAKTEGAEAKEGTAETKAEPKEAKAEPAEAKEPDPKTEKAKEELKVRIQQLEKTLEVVDQWLKTAEHEAAAKGDQAEISSALGIRQKTLDIVAEALNPIRDVLSKEQSNTLLKLVQKYLEYHVPEDVQIAQALLRTHLDSATPRAKKLLLYASPEAKALILKVFLGEPPVRQMNETAASEIVSWLTQGGMGSVVKVTYRPVGGRFSPHLSLTETGYEGAKDGFNLIHARTSKAEGHEALVTPAELKEIVQEAKDYVAQGQPEKNGANSLYDPATKTYRNWVVHHEGGSQIKVALDANGQVSKVVIQYSTKSGETQLATKFQSAKKEIEKTAEENGLKVELVPMDLAKFHETLPGKVGSLGRLEGFFKGYHEKPFVRKLEGRGLKKKFETTNPAAGALPKKPGTPEWLTEFLKKYFDGAEFIPEREAREKANQSAAEKEQKTEEALKEFGLTREEILADPKIVQKRFRQFALRYHPDRAATLGVEAEREAGEKFKQIDDYNKLLKELVDKAKENTETKGKPKPEAKKAEKADEAKVDAEKKEETKVEPPPTAVERGLSTFLQIVEKIPGGKAVIEITKGIRNFFAKQWYGQGYEAELEANRAERAEKRAKKYAEKVAKTKPKEPAVPEKPKAAEPGPKVEGPRLPLPQDAQVPGPAVATGERVGNVSPSIKQGAKEWMGEFSGRTDEGIGYGSKNPNGEVKNEDGIAAAYDKEGNLTLINADGMGGHPGSEKATKIILDAAVNEAKEGGDLKQALNAGNEARKKDAPHGSGAVVVAARIVRPAKEGEPYTLETAFLGDSRLTVLRRTKDGKLHVIYETVEETMLRDLENMEGFTKEQKDDMMVKAGPNIANVVVNSLAGDGPAKIRLTAEGEVPDPANPGKMKKAEGLDNIALEEGDIVLLSSDWRQMPSEKVAEQIRDSKTSEEINEVLHNEGRRQMQVLKDARDSGIKDNQRYKFKHEGKTLFIDAAGNVYEAKEGGTPVDHYKTDNFSVLAYQHNPTAPKKAPGPVLPPGGGDKALPEGKGETNPTPDKNTGTPPADSKGAADNGGKSEPPTDKNPAEPDPVKTEPAPQVAHSVPEAAPVKVRFKSAKNVDEVVRDYGRFFTADGIQFPGKNPPAEGTIVPFEFSLGTDALFLSGKGKIVTLPPADPANPGKPKMAIKFEELSPESQKQWEELQTKMKPKPDANDAPPPPDTKKDPPAPVEAAPAPVEAANPIPVEPAPAKEKNLPPQSLTYLENLDGVIAQHGTKFTADGTAPVSLPLSFRYSSQPEFVAGFGQKITPFGMTIPLKKPLEGGTKVHFKIHLIDGTTLFSGLGTVIGRDAKQAPAPGKPHPTEITFDLLDSKAKDVFAQIEAKKKEGNSGNKAGGDNGTGGGVPPAKKPFEALGVDFNAQNLQQLLEPYGTFFGSDGVFIMTETIQAVGTKVNFTFRLKDGKVFMRGRGTVVEAPPHLEGNGIQLRFDELTPAARTNLSNLLKAKEQAKAKAAEQKAPPSKIEMTKVKPAPAPAKPAAEVTLLSQRTTWNTAEQFIEGYPDIVGPEGLQIQTKQHLPVGAPLKFEFKTRDGKVVLEGQGTVVGSFPADPKFPNRPVGLMVKFTDISAANRAVVNRMLEAKAKKAAAAKERKLDFDDEPTLPRIPLPQSKIVVPPPPGAKPRTLTPPPRRASSEPTTAE